ncbi:MAG: hypothetical protein JXX29_00820 [Deltaproteobacteria bacterium]|nr:hypothetical protein [Deltaproteobacteria bacterium]MBN2670180.1 hypothetical protein [Deltaproteobacteria bacterium]
MKKKICPVFCDDCGALALAQMDNRHLCAVCLFKKLEASDHRTFPKFRLKPVKTIEDAQNVVFSTSSGNRPPLSNLILS